MTEAVERIMTQVSDLTLPERAELAYFILSSMDGPEDEVKEAWRAEVTRRVAEIRTGAATGRSADEVLAALRERYP